MNKIIHEICSLINLLDINRGFGLILTRPARYTGSVTGFRDTHLGQVAEPKKGQKTNPPSCKKHDKPRASMQDQCEKENLQRRIKVARLNRDWIATSSKQHKKW